MSKLMASPSRNGGWRRLFKQEFPEDDVSCFLATGDMYFDTENIDKSARECYPAPIHKEHLNVWYPPERGKKYQVNIDPGQARITETAINVMSWRKDKDGNDVPIWCARDSGLYAPELTVSKAIIISNYYNRATISWEANSHGLAISALLKNRRPIYFRKDVVSGKTILTPGWLTTPGNKEYMLGKVAAYLDRLDCKDIELVRQLRNIRTNGEVGLTDILMSLAIGLCTSEPNPIKRGLIGQSGWKW